MYLFLAESHKSRQPYFSVMCMILIPEKPFIPGGPWTLEPGAPFSPGKPLRPTAEIEVNVVIGLSNLHF